jgi:hypothetical protein
MGFASQNIPSIYTTALERLGTIYPKLQTSRFIKTFKSD